MPKRDGVDGDNPAGGLALTLPKRDGVAITPMGG